MKDEKHEFATVTHGESLDKKALNERIEEMRNFLEEHGFRVNKKVKHKRIGAPVLTGYLPKGWDVKKNGLLYHESFIDADGCEIFSQKLFKATGKKLILCLVRTNGLVFMQACV